MPFKINETGKQVYGTHQISKDSNGHTYEFVPVEDIEHVNIRRLEIGLEPIEDFAARIGIDWQAFLQKQQQKEHSPKLRIM